MENKKTITSLTSGDNKTNGKRLEAFKNFSNELNKELRTRDLGVIGTFDPRNRIGSGTTIYPPSYRQHSPIVAGGLMQQWAIECDYNTKTGKVWLLSTCPFMSLKIIASLEAFTDAMLPITRVEPIVRVDPTMNYGSGNFIKIEFDRKNIDDKYMVEIFADILTCLDMKMQEIDFTSGDFNSMDITEKSVTIISNK
jgi:hypothetical protein